ncbi:Uncharacterised protein [Mycobacteroides abscessus subsp. massiliense]|nr:Uncharacterised protein [Mycobacteroides abscessus subsp. massiliense]
MAERRPKPLQILMCQRIQRPEPVPDLAAHDHLHAFQGDLQMSAQASIELI